MIDNFLFLLDSLSSLTDAWLTEDLLNKLGNNDKLMAMMADPRCERALQEFQANPDKALLTYQHDKYIQEFFKEFCDVLGEWLQFVRQIPSW